MSQYYIVSDEMRKAKNIQNRNFAIHKELQELAEDIRKLEEKYTDNVFAMGALKEFLKVLENADIKKKGNKSVGFLKGLARKLGNDASANSPTAVAGTRG